MRALLCKKFGPPEDLVLEDVPSPLPGKGQVVITVKAAGVNFPDTLIIQDKYQVKPPLPFSPGGELAGVIKAVGEGVDRFKPGDSVLALTLFGAFAQEVVVDVAMVSPLPASVPFDLAASFVMAYGTSHHALKDRGQLRPGETLLVLGASGGVGLAAVEIGKALGARVIAAASSADKLAICREHGADEVIDYTKDDLRASIKQLTDGKGVDVIYDPVGGDLTEPAFRSLAWRGRFLVVGFAAGTIPKLPLNLALLKGASIVGVFWGDFARREPKQNLKDLFELFGWLSEGKLEPLISGSYSLERAPEALRALMDRKATGKLVVTP